MEAIRNTSNFKDFLLLLQQSGSSLFPRGNQILLKGAAVLSAKLSMLMRSKVDPDLLQMGLQAEAPSSHPSYRRWRRVGVGGREEGEQVWA